MSQENVEIVQGVVAAFNRGDYEAAVKDAAPDAVFDWTRALGPYRGVHQLDEILGVVQDLVATFDSARFDPDEFIDAGDSVVLVGTICLRGRDGIEVTAHAVQLWTIREGTVVHCCLYQDRQEALEAVGLSE